MLLLVEQFVKEKMFIVENKYEAHSLANSLSNLGTAHLSGLRVRHVKCTSA